MLRLSASSSSSSSTGFACSSTFALVTSSTMTSSICNQSSTTTSTTTSSSTFKPGTNPGNVSAPTNINYHPTEIESAYQLLRLLLRSADVKVRSRQGKQFMKRRIMSQWRVGREETDPMKQRAWMERAAAVLHAMHIKGRNPRPDEPIELDFTVGPDARRYSRSSLDLEEESKADASVEVGAEGKSSEKK